VQPPPGPRPFDVSSRQLIDRDPAAWLAWAGLPVNGPVRALDSEVSTVLAEVDKVLQVDADPPWLAHLELQASHDPKLPLRLLEYHALLLHRHEKRVASVVVLLRPLADGPDLTGTLDGLDPLGTLSISFRYRIMRVWERPVEELLAGGLGTLPLASLANVSRDELPSVIERLVERLDREATPDLAINLWSSTLLLLGLRYDSRVARELSQRVRLMSWLRESSTYQMILEEGREEGRLEGARHALIRIGTSKLGPPDPRMVAEIEAITDVDLLERLAVGVLTATSWDEVLASDSGN
jgi:predicted transposase YdaD